MEKFIKENRCWLFPFGGILLILVPIAIYALSSIPLFPAGGNNDWAGFWGGYLGAIIGAFVAILVMKQTIENEKTARREERQENFLSDIVELVAEFGAQVNKSNSHLLRFHATGEDKWNYEALYGMTEVAKLENILRIKMLSNIGQQYDIGKDLLNKILEVGKKAEYLHEVHAKTFDELRKQADEISALLSALMEQAMKFAIKD